MDEEDFFGNLVLYCIEADRATSGKNFYGRVFRIVEAALFKQRQEAKKLYNPYRNLFLESDDGESGKKPTQTRTVSASSNWTEKVGDDTATGVKYTITFSNWEQSTYNEKWSYKNTSGNFYIDINNTATDNFTKKSNKRNY